MPEIGSSQENRVEKPWGYELRWAVTDRYLGKILHVNQGEALSTSLPAPGTAWWRSKTATSSRSRRLRSTTWSVLKIGTGVRAPSCPTLALPLEGR